MKKFIVLLIILGLNVSLGIAEEQGEIDMQLTSPSFDHNSMFPLEFTCQGKDINPELNISGIPEETKSLALIMDDPDAPMGMWVHWVVFDISPITMRIKKNSIPGKQGINDFQRLNYGGPCPPSGTHRYFFKLYALDTLLNLKEGMIKKQDLEKAMEGHLLAQAELIGLYKK